MLLWAHRLQGPAFDTLASCCASTRHTAAKVVKLWRCPSVRGNIDQVKKCITERFDYYFLIMPQEWHVCHRLPDNETCISLPS